MNVIYFLRLEAPDEAAEDDGNDADNETSGAASEANGDGSNGKYDASKIEVVVTTPLSYTDDEATDEDEETVPMIANSSQSQTATGALRIATGVPLLPQSASIQTTATPISLSLVPFALANSSIVDEQKLPKTYELTS